MSIHLTHQGSCAVLQIDRPQVLNALSFDVLGQIGAAIDQVAASDARALVLVGSGEKAFCAGADIKELQGRSLLAQKFGAELGQNVMAKLDRLPIPSIAVIHGYAFGGGLELAMACTFRVATPKAKMGLPEIKLGLIPGYGGTQRLPRLVGAALGLRLLLDGNPLLPQQALEAGVVDAVVSSDQLITTAKRHALALRGQTTKPWDRPGTVFDSSGFDFGTPGAHDRIAAALGIGAQTRAHYPAYNSIMDCVVGGWHLPMDAALDWEMDVFVRLIQNPVAGNMVRTLFLNRQRASKAPAEVTQSLQSLLPPLQVTRQAAAQAGADEAAQNLAVALASAAAWATGAVPDTELADVAVVTADLHPAYTGGPFTYLQQTGFAELTQRVAQAAQRWPALFQLPAQVEQLCRAD